MALKTVFTAALGLALISAAPVLADEKFGSPTGKGSKKAAQPTADKPKPTGKMSYKDQREYDILPEKNAKLEAEIAALEADLSDGTLFTTDPAAFQKKVDRLTAARGQLETGEERWLELEMLREELGLS